MAPDSRLWRHQLGEANTGLKRSLLKATLPFCLALTFCTTQVEARTEPIKDTLSEISIPAWENEKPSQGESVVLSSLSPSLVIFNSSPAGLWSNRTQIHIPNQPTVQSYIRFYKGRGRTTFMDSLDRSWYYVPVMADILESYGVPAELVYVVLVESRFKGRASHRGAGGYWQLLASTARSMGLRVDRWVDERRDPVKSTQAAAKYLRSFYEKFHCWSLALAAYNAGDGLVAKAVRRSGASDFWELSRRSGLPGRTRTYVPKVLAAIQIMRDLEANGFNHPRSFPVYDFESTWIRSPLKLEQVAGWINVPVSQLQDLNPSLRLDRVPPDCGYNLRLPSGARDRFDMAYEDFLRK